MAVSGHTPKCLKRRILVVSGKIPVGPRLLRLLGTKENRTGSGKQTDIFTPKAVSVSVFYAACNLVHTQTSARVLTEQKQAL